ncbi:hypothetical protein [Saccharothrix sp. HUAS TT1]|uniref:hypothetical protein n=1 Tax=unclassified Saccharothrix TaxID=2593673 RepID=UPI00345B90BF
MAVFASCSYTQFRPWMGVPVRTSVGAPRHTPGYLLEHRMPQWTPRRDTLHLPYDEFRRAYRHQLHRTQRQALDQADILRAAAGVGDDVPLVLLCFEDLATVGLWCHRTLLAEWISAKTGLEVPEYGDHLIASPVTLPSAPAEPQLALAFD